MREPEFVAPDDAQPVPSAVAEDADGSPTDADAPGPARRRRWGIVAVAAIAGLVVGALGAAGVLATVDASERAAAGDPTVVVGEYVAAIAAQDAEAANAMLLPDASVASTALLDDAVLDEADPIELLRVESRGGGDRPVVGVIFLVDGVEVERDLDVVRDGSSWRIVTTLAQPVRLASAAIEVRLGDAVLPAPTGEGAVDAWLYPGVYRPVLQESPLLEARATRFVVSGSSEPVRVEAEGRATESLLLQAGVAVDAALAACVAAGCPTSQPSEPGLGSVVGVTVLDASGGVVQSGFAMLETSVSTELEVTITLDRALQTATIVVRGAGLP